MNKKTKQTNLKWMNSFFTMREEGQSFYKTSLGQKQLIDYHK